MAARLRKREEARWGEGKGRVTQSVCLAGSAAAGVSPSIQRSPALHEEEKPPLCSVDRSLNGGGMKEERKMDRAQLHPHLWKTGQDKGGGGDGEERGKASNSLRACVSLCICVCVSLCVSLPSQHGSSCQSFVCSGFQHHPACCPSTVSVAVISMI